MGITAIIGGILALLSTVGGIAGKSISEKNARENVNGMASQDDSGKGVSVASDVTGLAAQALSFVSGFGTSPSLPDSTKMMNKAISQTGPFSIDKMLRKSRNISGGIKL